MIPMVFYDYVTKVNPMYNVVNPIPGQSAEWCIPDQPKQESAMYNNALFSDYADITETTLQRRQLLSRADQILHDHENTLMDEYYISYAPQPKTANELRAALDAGEYYIDVKDDDKEHYNLLDKIIWRSKDKKPRRKEYETAFAQLIKDHRRISDDITIQPLDEALKALRKFETLH